MQWNALSVRPLGGVFVAEVTGVGIPGAPARVLSAMLAGAVARYGVLICRMPDAVSQGVAGLVETFSGERRSIVVDTGEAPGGAGGGRVHPEDDIALLTDPLASSAPSHLAFLHAESVPRDGAESIWCSLAGAYDNLSLPIRAYLDPLRVEPANGAKGQVSSLIGRHPVTGRKHFAIGNSFEGRILDIPTEESDLVLDLVGNLLAAPENQIRIPWTEDMIAIWDCRLAQHYAVGGYGAPGWRLSCVSVSGAAVPLIRPEAGFVS